MNAQTPEPSVDGMSRPSEGTITFSASYYLRRAISAGADAEGLSISEFVRRALTTFLEQHEPKYPRVNEAVRKERRRVQFPPPSEPSRGDPAAPALEPAPEQAPGLPAFVLRPVPTCGAPAAPATESSEETQ